MTSVPLPKLAQCSISRTPERLREDARYQKIRNMINSRYSPLSGGIDWEQIFQEGRQLLLTQGVDMVLASYLSVAAARTRGIEGLAFGLELMLCVVIHAQDEQTLGGDRLGDILGWAMGKLLPELKLMRCTQDNIKDWYRCEYACQQLYEALKGRGFRQADALDALGFQLFETLDKQQPTDMPVPAGFQQAPRTKWPRLSLLLACGACLLAGFLLRPWAEAPLQRQFPDLFPPTAPQMQAEPLSAWQRIEAVFANDSQLTGNEVDYLTQLDYLSELERYHQRFSAVRTRAANLERLIAGPVTAGRDPQLQSQAQGLAEYAGGLSPLLGRIYYIDTLLEQGAYERAQQELAQADRLLKGMLIKRSLQFGRLQAPRVLAEPTNEVSENLPAEQ